MSTRREQHLAIQDAIEAKEKTNGVNLARRITEYENGTMDEEQACEFFQYLVDSGIAWTLKGSYGRTAQRLIEAELIRY